MSSETNKLMINLTSSRSAAIAKALRFGRKFLAAGWQVHLVINVDAVQLINPDAGLEPCPVTGKPLTAILSGFISDGGKGLVGAECLKLSGLDGSDLAEGLEVATFPKIEALMLQPDIKILSY
jgi:predicted peroxiredoxin